MLKNERLRQIGFSVFSNTVVLMLSLVTGLFLPKFVSVETYASYKTFSLYSTYLGLFHFGFINGVYLKYGSLDYSALPKNRFITYTRFLGIFQIAVQIVLLICFLPYHIKTGSFISPFSFVIFNLFFINVSCYFNLINQFTRRFILDGTIQLVQKIICVAGIIILLLNRNDSYAMYLLVLTIGNVLTLVFLIITGRDLVFGFCNKIDYSEIKTMISRGFFIMISEYMGLIIVGIDGIIINLLLPQSSFSVYAFAVSIISVMYQLTNVIAKPIFPYLKRQSDEMIVRIYDDLKTGCILFAALVSGLSLYVPLIINMYIPRYSASIPIIQILTITVLIRAVHELVCGNYFKVLSLERLFVLTNLTAFITGVLTDILAFVTFRSMKSVAIASVVSFLIWYMVSDTTLRKRMNVHSRKGDVMLIGAIVLLIVSTELGSLWGTMIFYLIIGAMTTVYLKRTRFLYRLKKE